MSQGLEEGMSQGLEKGMTKGLRKGMATLLERLLTQRFGPLPKDAQEHLAKADRRQLETWGVRALDAPDLDAVFAGDTRR